MKIASLCAAVLVAGALPLAAATSAAAADPVPPTNLHQLVTVEQCEAGGGQSVGATTCDGGDLAGRYLYLPGRDAVGNDECEAGGGTKTYVTDAQDNGRYDCVGGAYDGIYTGNGGGGGWF
ncbi:hypothetical protein ACIO3O_32725 [Streptomyces sp. NPDC087440]|uniref:hypothetical protein n=1 Tax=Streptomyces sp. NPDC087440 TaxID=3365790 RepID=UPI00380BED44